MPTIALLMPTSTYRADDFLSAAARLDVDIVVVHDGDRHPLAGTRTALAFDDPDAAEGLADELADRGVDALLGVDDRGVVLAAHTAARLGLPANDPVAVARTRDKAALRTTLAGHPGVVQPAFRVVSCAQDVATAASEVGFPVVVKPPSLAGSQGVIRADDPSAAEAAAGRVWRLLDRLGEPSRPLLVERFLPGSEVAVEGLLTDGRLDVLAVFDKPDPLDGPFFEETLYVTPSRLPSTEIEALGSMTAAAAEGIGLRHGPVHAELRVDGSDVGLLEVAARTIGGLCGRSLRFGLDMSLEEVIIRHAVGLPVYALGPAAGASGALMLPIPDSGVLRRVDGLPAARAVPGIDAVEVTVPTGGYVEALPEGGRYLGFALARGRSAGAVESALRAAQSALTIDIEPVDGPADRLHISNPESACASD